LFNESQLPPETLNHQRLLKTLLLLSLNFFGMFDEFV
jgi:hypothetical protein